MIYFECFEHGSEDMVSIFFVDDDLSNFIILHYYDDIPYEDNNNYELYDNHCQTQIAPTLLDRWPNETSTS